VRNKGFFFHNNKYIQFTYNSIINPNNGKKTELNIDYPEMKLWEFVYQWDGTYKTEMFFGDAPYTDPICEIIYDQEWQITQLISKSDAPVLMADGTFKDWDTTNIINIANDPSEQEAIPITIDGKTLYLRPTFTTFGNNTATVMKIEANDSTTLTSAQTNILYNNTDNHRNSMAELQQNIVKEKIQISKVIFGGTIDIRNATNLNIPNYDNINNYLKSNIFWPNSYWAYRWQFADSNVRAGWSAYCRLKVDGETVSFCDEEWQAIQDHQRPSTPIDQNNELVYLKIEGWKISLDTKSTQAPNPSLSVSWIDTRFTYPWSDIAMRTSVAGDYRRVYEWDSFLDLKYKYDEANGRSYEIHDQAELSSAVSGRNIIPRTWEYSSDTNYNEFLQNMVWSDI